MVLHYRNPQTLTAAEDQRAWVEIDLDALRCNVRQILSILQPGTALMAVVKADAYGHGVIPIARTVLGAGAQRLAVATSQEGIALRQAGITAPILVLGAIHRRDEIEAIADFNLEPTLCTPQQALTLSQVLEDLDQTLPVHLNIDTGMSRLGTPWQEALALVQWVQRLPRLALASVYSHFATADDPDPQFMNCQHQRFQAMVAELRSHQIHPPALHIANSAALLSDSNLHYDWVRAGLALYGLYPAPHLAHTIPLKPVMTVRARITQVKQIPAGTGVSYGHHYVSDRPITLAVVGIGYADGIPRLLSQKMQGLLRGEWVAQIGAITMDQLMIDVSDFPDVKPGEVVTLLGQDGKRHITAEDWANLIGTISWEILCGFKQRLPRVYRDGES
ncbi:alanine racemase [Spirulina sp. CCNP1310]|uniref:alanine racemase n=1 Tax=Spirulina sp. CCNP1310 TaxID=3110249 RepID=UPI002B20288A|nr:alanine racemase [Spirulina sp. CCNP1310]MEA5419445.1 alanine racemase [Spirulina sp. CCNP1310]